MSRSDEPLRFVVPEIFVEPCQGFRNVVVAPAADDCKVFPVWTWNNRRRYFGLAGTVAAAGWPKPRNSDVRATNQTREESCPK